jgi:hypothetical protein
MIRSEVYRLRKEAVEVFKVLKNDFENFGSRVWYLTLRTELPKNEISSEKVSFPLVVIEDLP